jgi:glutamate formiminotransferase/formiminotetrahydrofolate cyclodeaminase
MEGWVECIPNFSEGRQPSTVRALAAVVRAVPGVFLLGEEMDADHHRAVLTFAGEPDAVAEAAFQCARLAAALIDLRSHEGAHPRVGATDVIPFVPLGGVGMDRCVVLARKVGERIGRELQIPVFLYERAAATPERIKLEAIRRGGLEGLRSRMDTDAAWAPDYGPACLHPTAGATVVGARPPLIAFNVNLQTEDVGIAKSIAQAVRSSTGGPPYVKALGLELRTRRLVQVSMNLTDYQQTPIHVAFEAVRREAAQCGVTIAGSEIIGLVPQQALVHVAASSLLLECFDRSQVLESRIENAKAVEVDPSHERPTVRHLSDESVSSFVDAVSAGTPTPGGGSVAALAGALAAALGVMACRVGAGTRNEKHSPAKEHLTADDLPQQLKSLEHGLIRLTSDLTSLIQQDADVYNGVLQAYRLPKTDVNRSLTIEENFMAATMIPLRTAELACEVGALLAALRPLTKPSVASDLRVGLFMVIAALEGGLENTRTNIKHITDQLFGVKISDRLTVLEQSLVELRRLC